MPVPGLLRRRSVADDVDDQAEHECQQEHLFDLHYVNSAPALACLSSSEGIGASREY